LVTAVIRKRANTALLLHIRCSAKYVVAAVYDRISDNILLGLNRNYESSEKPKQI